MAIPAKFRCPKTSFHLHRRSPRKLSFPLFSIDLAKSKPVRLPVIRASSNPIPSLFKNTCITLTASAALCSASFFPISKPVATTLITISTEEATPEKQLETQAHYMEELLSLTKIRYESGKYDQAIEILDRMIEIEPYEQKWSLMRARVLSYHCDDDSAIKALEEILAKDPICFEAYHYLVMVYYDFKPKLPELEKRITEAIVRCKKEKTKAKEIRDFRLLIAKIKVIEGNSDEAIRICEELVKEDPEDFRIYLFQGMVYLSMKNLEKAGKQFDETARMFPEFPDGHPYLESAMDSEWRAIVAYDEISCYFSTCARLMINTAFGKSWVHWFKRNGLVKATIMLVSGIQWLIRSS